MFQIQLIYLIVLNAYFNYLAFGNQHHDGSICETLPSSIHVTKEEHDEAGNAIRTCEGDIIVNKCEGTCNSVLQPSVVTPSGFLKDCVCCRETWMRKREIHLTDCFDADGQKLNDDLGMMMIPMEEPEGCECRKCGGTKHGTV